MIIKDHPYIDKNGKVHKNLVKIYSDLGVRLLQEDTGIMYDTFVVDNIHIEHTYRELTEDLGDLPTEQKENNPFDEIPTDLKEEVEA